jgi:ectoine hydroxylase-related dioxygenase (phytanoyl-CoA dioxygenase family)
MNIKQFDRILKEKGWVLLESVVPDDLVLRMAEELQVAYLHCRSLQERNGISAITEYTVHHLIGQGDSFIEYLEAQYIHSYLAHYFSGNYILNSFGGAINTRLSTNYAHGIHRDVRTFTINFPLLINTLVMLDAFTSKNGATFVLSGSHHIEEKPDEEYFYAHAEQVLGPAGSILIFDSNIWHAAGKNQTDCPRRSVTPMYSRPFIKQQFDYPRAIDNVYRERLTKEMRQIIGYNSRVPASLDEWYQPPEKRMYKTDQG